MDGYKLKIYNSSAFFHLQCFTDDGDLLTSNFEQFIDQIYTLNINEITEMVDSLNNCISQYDDFNISSYISFPHLSASLKNTLDPHYISSIILFYLNLTANLTSDIILFLTSDEFLSFVTFILQKFASGDFLENLYLIFTNLIFYDKNICIKLIENNFLEAISSTQSEYLYVMKAKSYLLSLFLQSGLDYALPIQTIILNEISESLHSHFDEIKCIAVKGLIKSPKTSYYISNYLKSDGILLHLCYLLKNTNSKKLTRLILTLLLDLAQQDDKYIIEIINSDFISIFQIIISEYEDRVASIILDLYQTVIGSKLFHELKLDFTFLLSFKNKGFIAKKKFSEFIIWMFQKKINFLNQFNNDQKKEIFFMIDDVAQSENEETCFLIADFYVSIENSECGKFLLSLLSDNEGFIHFVTENINESPSLLYIGNKLNIFNIPV